MKTIREFAKEVGFEIVGKLTRHPELEMELQWDGTKKRGKERIYLDEAGNEYIIGQKGVCIVDTDGGVI